MKTRLNVFLKLLVVAFLGVRSFSAVAANDPIPISGADKRIQFVQYNPDEIVRIKAFYGYIVTVILAPDEDIDESMIRIGFSEAWEILPNGNTFTIKPRVDEKKAIQAVAKDTATNLVVNTPKRRYHIELSLGGRSGIANSSNDKAMLYELRYKYGEPGKSTSTTTVEQQFNYRYEIQTSAPAEDHPYQIADNGTFTYIRFYAQQSDLAPFVVDSDGKESVVKYHYEGDLLVIERVAPHLRLRRGNILICVFKMDPIAYSPPSTTGTTDPAIVRERRK